MTQKNPIIVLFFDLLNLRTLPKVDDNDRTSTSSGVLFSTVTGDLRLSQGIERRSFFNRWN